MKVKMEEVKATRLVIVVNTLGVFGRDSDEVSSSSSTSTSPPTPCAKVGLLQLSIEHLLSAGKVKEERRHRCYLKMNLISSWVFQLERPTFQLETTNFRICETFK